MDGFNGENNNSPHQSLQLLSGWSLELHFHVGDPGDRGGESLDLL